MFIKLSLQFQSSYLPPYQNLVIKYFNFLVILLQAYFTSLLIFFLIISFVIILPKTTRQNVCFDLPKQEKKGTQYTLHNVVHMYIKLPHLVLRRRAMKVRTDIQLNLGLDMFLS
jgi:hypothetical protein